MKKTIFFILGLIIVFTVTLLIFFPYGDYISEFLARETGKTKDVQICWSKSTNRFPSTILDNVMVNTKKGSILYLDTLTLTPSLMGGIYFNGLSKEKETTLLGHYKNDIVNFDIKHYTVPDFLTTSMGTGAFDFKGTFNTKENTGKMDFSGELSKLPTPLITQPVKVIGEGIKKGRVSDITFKLDGNKISGDGRIYITDNPGGEGTLSGYINAKAGIIPIKIKLDGTTDNVKLRVGI